MALSSALAPLALDTPVVVQTTFGQTISGTIFCVDDALIVLRLEFPGETKEPEFKMLKIEALSHLEIVRPPEADSQAPVQAGEELEGGLDKDSHADVACACTGIGSRVCDSEISTSHSQASSDPEALVLRTEKPEVASSSTPPEGGIEDTALSGEMEPIVISDEELSVPTDFEPHLVASEGEA